MKLLKHITNELGDPTGFSEKRSPFTPMTQEERFTVISKEWPALHLSARPRYYDPGCMYIGQLVECTYTRTAYKRVQPDSEEAAPTPIQLPTGKYKCPNCAMEVDEVSQVPSLYYCPLRHNLYE